jgi:hypothetical protein
VRAIILLLPLLAGCACPTISFPIGAFALIYSDVSHVVREACDAERIPAVKCAQLAEYDKEVKGKIITPSKDIDWVKVWEMIGVAARLAAKGAM